MGHEISQFDISDRQLLSSNAQSRVGMWIDIGEAKITRTIFGRARIRVIREQDKVRRVWLLTALLVTSMAAASWHWWIASQQAQQTLPPPLPLSATIRVSAPTFQPEYTPPPGTPQSRMRNSKTTTQDLLSNLTTRREPRPQPPLDLKSSRKMAANPITAQPLPASKPQKASPATNNDESKTQTDMQPPPKLSSPLQPAENISAADDPISELLIKDAASAQSPPVDNQPPDPVSAQP